MDRHQRIGRESPFEQIIYFSLHPSVFHRHMQDERPMKIFRLADAVFNVGAVISDRTVDVGAAAH
jgi:hypothetical protein